MRYRDIHETVWDGDHHLIRSRWTRGIANGAERERNGPRRDITRAQGVIDVRIGARENTITTAPGAGGCVGHAFIQVDGAVVGTSDKIGTCIGGVGMTRSLDDAADRVGGAAVHIRSHYAIHACGIR